MDDNRERRTNRRGKRDRDGDVSSRDHKKASSPTSVAADPLEPATKKARKSESPVEFPAVLRVFKPRSGKKTIFDGDSLSSRACQLWRSPSGAKLSAHFHQPAGVCRRLGVVELEFAIPKDSKYLKTNEKIYSLLKGSAQKQVETLLGKPSVSVTKTDCRKDAISIYGKDFHKNNEKVTQTGLMSEIEADWRQVLSTGSIEPQWNKNGEYVDPSAPTSCNRLLQLLKEEKLEDMQSGRECVLFHGLKHIPTDAESVLSAVVELSKPTKDLYSMPLLVSLPKVSSIERPKSNAATVQVSVGIYASRLLFEVMTSNLEIVMAAFCDDSVNITEQLSSPPAFPVSGHEDAVFACDPNGPKVHFGFDDLEEDDDDSAGSAKMEGDAKMPANTEFEDAGASDGTLDAFSPSGFLKLVENTGCNMDSFEKVKALLRGKLKVELMLHQEHALSFMWKAEHLSGRGVNGLLWTEREFPDSRGRYFFSPVLGQLRLALSNEPVRGGILADEMGLGKTCSVLSLIIASLSEVKQEASQDKNNPTNPATLIVVPPALLSQWVTEVAKVAGDNLVVDVFDCEKLEFQRRSNHSGTRLHADIVLTTYRALDQGGKGHSNKAVKLLLSTRWARVVLDEMQEVRSHTSSISKNCNALLSNRRWMLSGTPLFEGFSDLRGELVFLRLDPFGADSEDGFFRFAVEQHLDNRSRYGLETLRVLSLLLLRRSKSMIVKATKLPLLGLKRMSITFQPISQDSSERAVYAFLEHLMHSVLSIKSEVTGNTGRQKDKASGRKRSFLRMLRDVCASVHLLNGGLGCQSQISILDVLMKAYNRTFIQERTLVSDDDDIFTCDEAIRFISQADDQMNVQDDFVSDTRMGHGGGIAARNRATLDKSSEKLEEAKRKISSKNSCVFSDRCEVARLRWWKALELITTGGLSDAEYAVVNNYCSSLWKARRTSRYGHGWRPRSKSSNESLTYLETLRRRGFEWANPSALQCSSIPNEVCADDVKESFADWTKGDKDAIQLISKGPCEGSSTWRALVLLGNARLVRTIDDHLSGQKKKKNGLNVKSGKKIPHIEEQLIRAKRRYDTAVAMAVVHPSHENSMIVAKARDARILARAGIRAFGEYKEGHVLVKRAFVGFRLQERPRHSIVDNLNTSIGRITQSINETNEEIGILMKEANGLLVKQSNNISEKAQGLTAVEALQALQNDRVEETTCPVCQETLGDNGGHVAATQCGHLSCSGCMDHWKKEKHGQTLTCMECRKPVHRVITIDPSKKEDKEAIAERKKDAGKIVQKAARLLMENGSGMLDPGVWGALYDTMELPPRTNLARNRKFPAIPGDVLGHIRNATNLPINYGAKSHVDPSSVALSSKVRALLNDLPKDELSVVFTSSKMFLMHLAQVFELKDIGCRALYTGQKDRESRDALDDWHNDSKVVVLLVQAGAAACGLTLTASSKLFLMEPFAKYEEEKQAYARLHRYGQTKEVSCTVYYTPVSIESRLLEWRKNSNGYAPVDEEVKFASLGGLNRSNESYVDSYSEDEEECEDNKEDDDGDLENQTKFLLNLQPS